MQDDVKKAPSMRMSEKVPVIFPPAPRHSNKAATSTAVIFDLEWDLPPAPSPPKTSHISKDWTKIVESMRQAIIMLSMHLKKTTPYLKLMHEICFRFLQDVEIDIWEVIEDYRKTWYSPKPITHIGIVYKGSKLEYVPPGFYLVEQSVGNRAADLNRGGHKNCHVFIGRGENLPPITALSIISASSGEDPPLGFEAVYKTTGSRAANLHGEKSEQKYLCYSRGDGPPITDIAVVHLGKKEKVAEDFHVLERTLFGKAPYIDSNKTVIAYRRDYTSVLNIFKPRKDEKCSNKEQIMRKCLTCIVAGFYSHDLDIFIHSLMAFTMLDSLDILPRMFTSVICILSEAVSGYLSHFSNNFMTSVPKFVKHIFKERLHALTPESFWALLHILLFLRRQDSKDNVSKNVLLKKLLKNVNQSLQNERKKERLAKGSREKPTANSIVKSILHEIVDRTTLNKVMDEEVRDFFRTKLTDCKLRRRAVAICKTIFPDNKWYAMLGTTVLFLSKVSSEELPENLSNKSEIIKRRMYATKLLQHILESSRIFFQRLPGAQLILRRCFTPAVLESCITSVPGIFRNVTNLYICLFKYYRDILKLELGVILKSGFMGMVMSKYCTSDQKIDILDIISNIVINAQDFVDLFYNYDSSTLREVDMDVCAHLISVVQRLSDPGNVSHIGGDVIEGSGNEVMKRATSLLRKFMEYLAEWANVPNLQVGGNLEELSEYSNPKQFIHLGELKDGLTEQSSETIEQKDHSTHSTSPIVTIIREHSLSIPEHYLQNIFYDEAKAETKSKSASVDFMSENGEVTILPKWMDGELGDGVMRGGYQSARSLRSTSWANRFTTNQENKVIIEKALDLCRGQKLKSGLKFLRRNGGARGSIWGLAKFLHENDALDKAEIGEFISAEESSKFLNADELKKLRREYCALLDFTGMKFDDAFRMFLTDCGFRMPKEAQKVGRMVEAFANAFVRDNPKVFKNEDACLLVAYAVIMLNTDLNDPRGKKKNYAPMSRENFHKNLAGAGEDTKDITVQFTNELYASVLETPIEWIEEDDDYVKKEKHLPLMKQRFQDECKALIRRVHGELRRVSYYHRQYHSTRSKVVIHGLFKISWANFIACITTHLNDQFGVEVHVYQMMKFGATTSLMLGFYEEMEAFLHLLARCLFVSEHPHMPPELLSQKMVEGVHLKMYWYSQVHQLYRTKPDAACQIISRLANDLRAKHIYDSRQQILRNLELKFGNDVYLAHPEREFKRQGALRKIDRQGNPTEYIFFLFSDMLIYALRTGNMRYKVHRTLHLGLVDVREAHIERYEHVFTLVSPQKTLHLVAYNNKEKQEWMEVINQNIREYIELRDNWIKLEMSSNSKTTRMSQLYSRYLGRKSKFHPFEVKRATEFEQTKNRKHSRKGSSKGSIRLLRNDSEFIQRSSTSSSVSFADLKMLRREQPCKLCLKPYSLFRRNYKCPWCGDLVCMNCIMKERIQLSHKNKPETPVREQRVCDACGFYINEERNEVVCLV